MNGKAFHNLLFHPIAGDSRPQEDNGPLLSLRSLQFESDVRALPRARLLIRLLDERLMLQMSVANITAGQCTEAPGGLSDVRMGAAAGSGRPCRTCGQQHHN